MKILASLATFFLAVVYAIVAHATVDGSVLHTVISGLLMVHIAIGVALIIATPAR